MGHYKSRQPLTRYPPLARAGPAGEGQEAVTAGPLDSAYWRKRAEEARATAREANEAVAEATMLSIARMYDELADRAEAREQGKLPDGDGHAA